MGKIVKKPGIGAIKSSGAILALDVLKLRYDIFSDGIVKADEADLIFDLNDNCTLRSPEWERFFVESLTDYLVFQVSPQGYVSEENAAWLIKRIVLDDRLKGATELELLVNVIDKARSCPVSLVTFALDQVKAAIVTGDDYISRGQKLTPGVINAPEVELIRRILYAFGGDGNIAITRPEAELMFALNDATIEDENHPLWSDLFVKSIANYLMAHSGYEVPTRYQALKREGWIEGRRGTGGFLVEMLNVKHSDFSKVLGVGLKEIFNLYHRPVNEAMQASNAACERGVKDSEVITADEAGWLIDSIEKDGILHENEKALLLFIREECPDIHGSLKPLMAEVA